MRSLKSLLIATTLIPALALAGPVGRLKYRPAQYGPIDFRLSYFANVVVDGHQTSQFPFRNIEEYNPFLSPFVTKERIHTWFPVVSFALVVGIDSWIDTQDDSSRRFFYALAWLIHSATISSNAKLGVYGFPLALPVLKFKF